MDSSVKSRTLLLNFIASYNSIIATSVIFQVRNTRRVLFEGYLDGAKQHTMRIRSVMAIGGAELMLDYIEIVPKSVYGVDSEDAAEDDN